MRGGPRQPVCRAWHRGRRACRWLVHRQQPPGDGSGVLRRGAGGRVLRARQQRGAAAGRGALHCGRGVLPAARRTVPACSRRAAVRPLCLTSGAHHALRAAGGCVRRAVRRGRHRAGRMRTAAAPARDHCRPVRRRGGALLQGAAANACIAGWTAPARPTTRSTIFLRLTVHARRRGRGGPAPGFAAAVPDTCSAGQRHRCGRRRTGCAAGGARTRRQRRRAAWRTSSGALAASCCARAGRAGLPDGCCRPSARPAGSSGCSRRSAWSRWRPPSPRTLPAA